MESIGTFASRMVALPVDDVDTDQIIPAEYLKRVTRTGFADGLFSAWRSNPDFILNQPAAQGASILIAGPDFGIGSSREHAVWALMDYGFRAVISSRFGDIFRSNATKGGLLPVRMADSDVSALMDLVEADPEVVVTVDLDKRQVSAGRPGEPARVGAAFDIDDYTRWRLMEGLDDISLTLRHSDDIARYESTRPAWLPTAV